MHATRLELVTLRHRNAPPPSLLALGACLALCLLIPEPRAAAQPPEGRLNVMSTPLGEVVIDGESVGARTPARALTLAAGVHEVSVRFPGSGRTASPQRVEVRAGETSFAFFRDRPAEGDLEASCTRGEDEACWMLALNTIEGGELAAAKPHLEAYLRHFPEGAYAETARAMLAAMPAEGHADDGPHLSSAGAFAAILAFALVIGLGFGGLRSRARHGGRG
jgi:hypothetical protein